MGSHSSNPTNEQDQKMILYGLLKVFHIFINVINAVNRGNTDIVYSILRDYKKNWDEFYKLMFFLYFKPFYKKLETLKVFKITMENEKNNNHVIKIEFNYPIEDNDGDVNVSVIKLGKIENLHERLTTEAPSSEQNNSPQKPQINFAEARKTRKYLTSLLWTDTRSFMTAFVFLDIFNHYLKWDVPAIKPAQYYDSEGKLVGSEDTLVSYVVVNMKECAEDQDVSVSPTEDEIVVDNLPVPAEETLPVLPLFEELFQKLREKEEVDTFSGRTPEEEDSLNEQIISAQNVYKEILENTTESNQLVAETKELQREILNIRTTTTVEEDQDSNKENDAEFMKKLEEQKKKHREELKRAQEEREKKKKEFDEEIKEIRRLQKQRFAILFHCILLNQRFEEKEQEWSEWIENCYRKLIVRIISQFDVFRDMARSFKNFRKVPEDSIDDVNTDMLYLNRKVWILIHDLSDIFKNFSQIDKIYSDVLFIRVLQKNVCDIATKLIDIYTLLEKNEISSSWYQELEQKIVLIEPSDVPTVKQLRDVCQKLNPSDYENLEFPKRKSDGDPLIEEVTNDDEPNEEFTYKTNAGEEETGASGSQTSEKEENIENECNFEDSENLQESLEADKIGFEAELSKPLPDENESSSNEENKKLDGKELDEKNVGVTHQNDLHKQNDTGILSLNVGSDEQISSTQSVRNKNTEGNKEKTAHYCTDRGKILENLAPEQYAEELTIKLEIGNTEMYNAKEQGTVQDSDDTRTCQPISDFQNEYSSDRKRKAQTRCNSADDISNSQKTEKRSRASTSTQNGNDVESRSSRTTEVHNNIGNSEIVF